MLISPFRLCGAPGQLCGFVVPELIKRKAPIDLLVVFEVNGDLDGEVWVSLSPQCLWHGGRDPQGMVGVEVVGRCLDG